ncbi:MAG: DNA-3-methyladenine glycosylase [Candidatus Absconditabacterales bacterium]
MQKILSQKFFDRNPVTVCKELLGKFLVIKKKGVISRYMITEVEAYDGQEDEACHARHGKTERNAPMFNAAGCWYVYMIYGMYYMLNIVTGPGKHPSAILVRGVERLNDIGLPRASRTMGTRKLNGPGKLTKDLGIDKSFNGKIANEKTGLRVEQKIPEDKKRFQKIFTAPRIGIDYASDEWRYKHWRFYI